MTEGKEREGERPDPFDHPADERRKKKEKGCSPPGRGP